MLSIYFISHVIEIRDIIHLFDKKDLNKMIRISNWSYNLK